MNSYEEMIKRVVFAGLLGVIIMNDYFIEWIRYNGQFNDMRTGNTNTILKSKDLGRGYRLLVDLVCTTCCIHVIQVVTCQLLIFKSCSYYVGSELLS